MTKLLQINNFIDLDVLQNIQDNFSKSTGFSLVTVDYKGEPVTETSGFTDFCNCIRKREEFCPYCKQCDAHGGLHAAIEGKPHIYRCHAGLVDFAVPLMVDGSYLGAILGGQTLLEDNENIFLGTIVDKATDWNGDEELSELFSRIRKVPCDKLYSTAMLLYEMSNYIVEKAYINLINEQLNEKNMELIKEEKARIELENSLKEAELKALYDQINPDFLFNVLNTVARLAYVENAKQSEEIVYAFSDMMRYTLRREKVQMVTLGEELIHMGNYLKIQKMRMRERISYHIDIPNQYHSLPCPYMIFQPIVENCVNYAVEPRSEGGNITVVCRRDKSGLIIEITDNGCGMSREKIQAILMNNEYKSSEGCSMGLFNINHRLISFYGKEYELRIRSLEEISEGTVVEVRLPDKRG